MEKLIDTEPSVIKNDEVYDSTYTKENKQFTDNSINITTFINSKKEELSPEASEKLDLLLEKTSFSSKLHQDKIAKQFCERNKIIRKKTGITRVVLR